MVHKRFCPASFLPVHQKTEILENLRRNWFFPISALGIFFLNARFNLGFFLGVPIAFLAAVLIASQVPSLLKWEKENPLPLRLVSILSAIGICWGEKVTFYSGWAISPKALSLTERFPMLLSIIHLLSIAAAVVGVCFAYFWVLAFLRKLVKLFSDSGVFRDITSFEWILYGLLTVCTIGWMIFAFSQTKAFYETYFSDSIICGAIYTSDSPLLLVDDNAFLSLTNSENDIRQPLFAVFAAPFMGLPYLIGRLTGGSSMVEAILMNSVQIVMLYAGHILLSKLMKLSSGKRICLVLLASCCYNHLLFTLMMEQYIVVYFYLMLCLYMICEKRDSASFPLYGAGGTLITSMALMPFVSKHSPFRDWKAWFWDMVRCGLGFLAMLLVFCRFDVLFNAVSKFVLYSNFFGKELGFSDKFYQFTAFISSCLLRPDAGAALAFGDHVSWQLKEPSGIHLMGVIILVLLVFSAIWNRKKLSSRFAFGWIGFSVVILLLLGWGTSENGLILYGLYFGWAILMLLFQLIEKLGETLKLNILLPLVSLLCAAILLYWNVPSILEMVQFAIQYYPT